MSVYTDEKKKWEKLSTYGVDAHTVIAHFIDGREVGSKRDLCKKWGVTEMSLLRYLKKGMPTSPFSFHGFPIFDILQCEEWRGQNINPAMSRGKNPASTPGPDPIVYTDSQRKTRAEADKAEIDAKRAEVKLAEEQARLVDADDLDRAMSEQAVIHRTDKTNDEKILPVLLENRCSDEIARLLYDHNRERLKVLNTLVNKTFECDETLYEVVEAVLQKLVTGVSPEELIKKVQG